MKEYTTSCRDKYTRLGGIIGGKEWGRGKGEEKSMGGKYNKIA